MSLHIPETVIWQRAGDGVSLYHTETGQFMTLNTSAAQIWALLEGEEDRESIVTRLTLLYGGANSPIGSRVGREVAQFIDSFVRDGLITESDSAAA